VTATAAALAGAARDARRAWDVRATAGAAVVAIASVAPLVVSSPRLEDVAAGLYLALAATGLALAVGVAGMPSLAQGAFMAVGAFTAAQLRIHGGLPTFAAALVGAAEALGEGFLGGYVGGGVQDVVAYLVALGFLAFAPSGLFGQQAIRRV